MQYVVQTTERTNGLSLAIVSAAASLRTTLKRLYVQDVLPGFVDVRVLCLNASTKNYLVPLMGIIVDNSTREQLLKVASAPAN